MEEIEVLNKEKNNEESESKVERVVVSNSEESKTDLLRSIKDNTKKMSDAIGSSAKTVSTLAHYNFDFFLFASSYFLVWLAAKNYYVAKDTEMCYYLIGASVLCSIGQNKIASGPLMEWLRKTVDNKIDKFLTRIERK